MTFRGIVQNGIVLLEAGAKLPEGQPVEVTALPSEATDPADLPGFGLWRDRDDLPNSAAEASLRLRQAIERRE
jgi:hypothetical protein